MASRIEDYALLSDLQTGALLGPDGSVDWLCLPRFDAPAVFAALLGTPGHGRWLLAPADPAARIVRRGYVGSSFVLETLWETDTGSVKVTDFMPVGPGPSAVIRRLDGVHGVVEMHQELVLRPGYGQILPWVRRVRDAHGVPGIVAVAGPDALVLRGDHLPRAVDHKHAGTFVIVAGERVAQELSWYPSHRPLPAAYDGGAALAGTLGYWEDWAARYNDDGVYAPLVERSLLVLRALTHADTGGIVAAPTTSLPEVLGGDRNWDYRFCWLRDAALTLTAMLTHGYEEEALHWRNWLLRAVAGDPEDLQILYGLGGERDLTERELAHLPGYEHSTPVRVGNGAVSQYQADVVGEVLLALAALRRTGGQEDHFSWPLQVSLLTFVERHLEQKDHGIWEMRGPVQYFTHSRVMMWAALDYGVRAVHDHGLQGPAARWATLRDDLREEILRQGYDPVHGTFTQSYGGTGVDASLLVLAQVGFVAYDSVEMLGTVAALERELLDAHGLLARYTTTGLDGFASGENPFLACSFWLVEQYAHTGRRRAAVALMDRLVGLTTGLGLFSEEYSTAQGRMSGNYPQAFTHLALVRAADALHATADPGAGFAASRDTMEP